MNHYLQTSTLVCNLRRLAMAFLAITALLIGLNQTVAQSNLIVATGQGGFEVGGIPTGNPVTDFGTNGWQIAQGASNRWFRGNAGTPFAGSYHAFTSADATTWTGQNANSVNHLFRDVIVPSGEPILNFSFRFKVSIEDPGNDYLRVHIVSPTVNPVAGTLLSTGQLAQLNGTTFYTEHSFATNAAPGTTIRVVLSYRTANGAILGSAALDNITLNSFPATNFTATTSGGFWSNPETWVGGVVPPAGNNITIPAGSRVIVNQPITYNSLTLNGGLQWSNNSLATFTGNIIVGAAGNLYLGQANQTGQSIVIGGNLTNNGSINASAAGSSMTFNANGNASFTGNGTCIGTAGRGVIRRLRAENRGSFTINTNQSLTVSEEFTSTSNSVITNNKLRIDNAADVFETSVNQLAITNVGANYASAPVVHGQSVVAWTAGGSASNGTRYYVSGQVYLCTAGGTFDVVPPANLTPVAELNGTATLLWVGQLGNLGASFQISGNVLGSQYYCGNNLYLALNAGNASALAPPTHVAGTALSGSVEFLYLGTVARASLNWDAASQTVRSLNLLSTGSGYFTAPSVIITNTGSGAGAAATAVIPRVNGPVQSETVKATATTYTGTIDIRSSVGPVAAGVGNITTTTRGYYTVAPLVGFTAPSENNLVLAQGSGYTSMPTVNVLGGTAIGTGDPLTFQVNIALGRIISVYCTGGTQAYVVPPALTITGGGGAGATIGWGTAWPLATANLNSNGILTGFTITNAGFGYLTAPGVVISDPLPGEIGASSPTCRIQQYGLKFGVFAPQTSAVLVNAGAAIPANNRLLSIEAVSGGGIILTSNVQLYGENPLIFNNGFIDGGSFGISCSSYKYEGTTGNENSFFYNGPLTLTLPGGQANAVRTFSMGGGTGGARYGVYTTGAASGLSSGYTFTGMTASDVAMPTGALPAGYFYTGNRAFRVVQSGVGTLASNNAGRNFTLSWNNYDNLIGDISSVFLVQGVSATSSYAIRSAPQIPNGLLPNVGALTSVTVATPPASIIPNNSTTMFFCFARANTFIVPPALSYNAELTSPIPYFSILGPSLGGDASGTPFPSWTAIGGNVGDEEYSDIVSLVVPGNAFVFQGQPVTGFRVHTNGFLQLENGTPLGLPLGARENNFSNKEFINVITPFWEDLTVFGYNPGNPAGSAANRDLSIRYRITGIVPNRILTVEYARMTINGFAGPDISFQIILDESTNSIVFNYGAMQLFYGTQNLRYSYSCGIKGRYNQSYPAIGQVFAQQIENIALFGNQETQVANLGANGHAISPLPRTRLTFTPGVYTPPAPPLPLAPGNDDIVFSETVPNTSVYPPNIAYDPDINQSRLYTTRFATSSPQSICTGSAGVKDVWFNFTAIEENTTVRIYPSGGFIPTVQILDNSFVSIGCFIGTAGQALDANLSGLILGNTYFVRVYHNLAGATATFQGGFVSLLNVPNISIVNSGTNYTLATPTTPTAPGGARLRATGGAGNTAIGAISQVTLGQVTDVAFDGGNNYLFTPTIETESPDWGITGEFGIVVYAPPINDNCSGAKLLTNIISKVCVPGQNQILANSSQTASQSPETTPNCDVTSGPDDDLWFRFVATNVKTKIQVKGNGGFNPVFQVWFGNTCSAKSTLSPPSQGCVNQTGINGLEVLEFTSVVNRIYYVRVYHAGVGAGISGATFDICVTSRPDIDIATTALLSPLGSTCGNVNQNVTVQLRNLGGTTLTTGTNINVTATITGPGGPYILNNPFVLAANLVTDAAVTVNVGNFNMSTFGAYTFNVTATIASDADLTNNSLLPAPVINVVIVNVPPNYSDGLNAQGNWEIRQIVGEGNWVFTNTTQRSGAPASPLVPFDEGNGYLFFNSFNFIQGATSLAISPCFSLPPTATKVQFRMKRDNVSVGLLDRVALRVSTDQGVTFSNILTLRNTTLDRVEIAFRRYNETPPNIQWHTFEADLAPYLGQTIKIGIEALSLFGQNMMVDDFRVIPALVADVQPINIVSPNADMACNANSFNVAVRFKNNSFLAASNVPYSVNIGGGAVPNVFNGIIPVIPANSEIDVTVGSISTPAAGTLGFFVSTSLLGDAVASNNNIGPVLVPLRTNFSYSVSMSDPFIIQGFGTNLTGNGTLGAPTANLTNAVGYEIPVQSSNGFPIEIFAPLNVTSLGNQPANSLSSVQLNLTHTRLQELTLTLIDPLGVQRQLFVKRGGTNDHLTGTIFSGTAVTPIASGSAPFTGSFLPEQPFSGFSAISGSANGIWQLYILDDVPFSEGGELLNFTLTFANGFSTATYTCPTCPSGFPDSPINPVFSLDYPSNPFGGTYPNGTYPIRFDIVDRQGCSAFNNFSLRVIEENIWLGVNPGVDNWQDAANWLAAPRPPQPASNITIPANTPFSPNIATSAFINNVTSLSAKTNIGTGASLEVSGSWNGFAKSDVTGDGRVEFVGTGVQNISGTTDFTNVRLQKTTGAIEIEGKVGIFGTLNIANNTSPINVQSNGRLIFRSNATTTGRLGSVPVGASLTGDIVMERYLDMPANETGRWHFIGAPVSGSTISDWGDDFRVAGPTTSATGTHYGALPKVWNLQEPERATVFTYNEGTHNIRFDTAQKIGWKIAPASNIAPGSGYRVWIDRYSLSAKKFDNKGAPVVGGLTFPALTRNEFGACVPATFNCFNSVNEFYRGWNLLANPYPSDIDWDASGVGTWNKPASMLDAYYRWNGEGSGYGFYVGGSGVWAGTLPAPANPNIIPSSQGFFVKLSQLGTYTANLSINENAKVNSSGGFLRTYADPANRLIVELKRSNEKVNGGYRGVVTFDPHATDGLDPQGDLNNMGAGAYSFTFPVEGSQLVYTTFGELKATKTVPINISFGRNTGTYFFSFKNVSSFMPGASIYLFDKRMNTMFKVDENSAYEFRITSANINDKERFELLFDAAGGSNFAKSTGSAGLVAYPNPSDMNGTTKLLFSAVSSKGQALLTVFNAMGKEVYEQMISTRSEGIADFTFNHNLPAGVYQIKVEGNKNMLATKLIIK